MYYMVTCQLLFVQQYQLGFVVKVLNIYIIHSESHLGFNIMTELRKGDFQKMSSSSSHFRLHHFSLPLREKPFLSMLGSVLRLPFLFSPTRFPFCLSLLSWNETKTVAFAGRVEIFQGRWPTQWISQGGSREFWRIPTPVIMVSSDFREKPLFVIFFSLNCYFTKVHISLTCHSIFCKWKKIKIHFPR